MYRCLILSHSLCVTSFLLRRRFRLRRAHQVAVDDDVLLDHTFSREDDVAGAEDAGAAGDLVAGFGLDVFAADGGFGWHGMRSGVEVSAGSRLGRRVSCEVGRDSQSFADAGRYPRHVFFAVLASTSPRISILEINGMLTRLSTCHSDELRPTNGLHIAVTLLFGEV